MSDTSSDFNCDVDATGETEQEGTNAKEEIFLIIRPYLRVKSTETEEKLKGKLNEMGVSNMSHLSILDEKDFKGLITVADFRLMMKKIIQTNASAGSQGGVLASPLYVVNLEEVMGSEFFQILKQDEEILTKQMRTKLVQNVADSISTNVRPITDKYILKVATKIIKTYPTSLGCLMKDNEDLKEASLSLKFSLMNRINYIRGEQRRKKLARKRASLPVNLEEEEVDEIEEETSKKKRFSKAEEYGLDTDRDLPNELPASETPTTQEAKRLLLANHNKSGESMSFACLMKLMKETYYMQRSDINTGSSMDKILERWPFIGMQPVLQTHFEHLMDMSVSDAINEAKAKLFPNLIAFFVTETSKKRFGDAKAIPLTLKSLLKRNSKSDDPALLFVTVILCCIVFMKVPKDSIFLTFEETTSLDEVQSSTLLPSDGKPIIAVLGSDLQLLPKAYVLVDNCIINDQQVSTPKALMALLMCHFVFKIQYGARASPLLHFIQRKIFNIKAEGTRTGRGKTKNGKWQSNPAEHPAAYLDFSKKFQEYCLEWNVDVTPASAA